MISLVRSFRVLKSSLQRAHVFDGLLSLFFGCLCSQYQPFHLCFQSLDLLRRGHTAVLPEGPCRTLLYDYNRVSCFNDSCAFESPARGLSYHADSSRYFILVFLLNHYAWVHVQYTPARGGNPHTPRTQPHNKQGHRAPRTVPSSPTCFMFILDTILHQYP